jgi:DNA-binding response OmpR family regulator
MCIDPKRRPTMAQAAKILIIDDDADLVESMRVVLESKQYSVVSADSGEKGLEKFKAEHPDLVILDVMMETGDKGFEVSRKMRAEGGSKKVPILMLTAVKAQTGMGFSRQAGDETWLPVDAYMEKPLKPEELLAKVDELLKSA